jgi:transposase-like protein
MPNSTLMVWLEKSGWIKPEPQGPISDDPAVLKTQVQELRRQVKRLEMEKEILKKATAYFASQNLSGSTSSTSGEGSSR